MVAKSLFNIREFSSVTLSGLMAMTFRKFNKNEKRKNYFKYIYIGVIMSKIVK